jgi:hypothetical protein
VGVRATGKRITAKAVKSRKPQSRNNAKPKLLAGGNPQIAKGESGVPVQAFIAAMPGWEREVGRLRQTG